MLDRKERIEGERAVALELRSQVVDPPRQNGAARVPGPDRLPRDEREHRLTGGIECGDSDNVVAVLEFDHPRRRVRAVSGRHSSPR